MLPYKTLAEAEVGLSRPLTNLETIWFNYSSNKSDYFLFCHNILFLFILFSLVPLPLVFMELEKSKSIQQYKIQPKVKIPEADMFRCLNLMLEPISWDAFGLDFESDDDRGESVWCCSPKTNKGKIGVFLDEDKDY
ncbi:Methylsterol monooxygenase 1-1 [Ranunculus cassubicifolius]